MTIADDLARLTTPPVGQTRLQLDRSAEAPMTLWRETDARTALTRGLREYIEQLSASDFSGREIRFMAVYDDWAEGEELADYPAAIVHAIDEADYDASSMTPKVTRLESGYGYWSPCELMLDLMVEIIATDNQERRGCIALLEDAFSPVSWMYGFRLDLPHYHNVRAVYEPLTVVYEDDELDARMRNRRAAITIQGKLPVVRIVNKAGKPVIIPLADIRPDVRVNEDAST